MENGTDKLENQPDKFVSRKQKVVEWPNVALQKGAFDCGLFAIAFATSLCNDEDPSKVEYQQKLMRSHLAECFNNEHIRKLPVLKQRKKMKPRLTQMISFDDMEH